MTTEGIADTIDAVSQDLMHAAGEDDHVDAHFLVLDVDHLGVSVAFGHTED